MKKLIMATFLGLIVSCATPTTPKFPAIDCEPVKKLTDTQLARLSHCKEDIEICSIPRGTLIQIFNNYQNKADCLEKYQAISKAYR